jgi:uncharacterized protein (DUF58 family)
LLRLAARHEVLAIEIRDPREQEIPNLGHVWLVDPETGRRAQVDTGRRRIRERFAAVAAEDRATLARELTSLGVSHAVLTTAGVWLRPLASFLERGRRRR